MTALLEERPAVHPAPPAPTRPPSAWRRLTGWLLAHRVSLLLLLPILGIGTLVNAWGLGHAPQRVDDEGTYVAQAYAVEHFGQLAHYTYWYDHPPLGWLQIAAWTTLTDGFDRITPAVVAGREAMLVAAGVSAVLLWVLARRAGLSRPTAALAAALFLLSPLAVAYHRMVYLDNVATPWLLAAFVLAAPRRHELASFAGSACCFAVAVLTKETFLLLAPALVWWAWRHADRHTRRYTFTVAGTLFAALTFGYVVFATLRGELFPGAHHVSLVTGIKFQLLDRKGSGSVLDPHSQASDTVKIWLAYDWVLPTAATICSLALIALRRLRPLAFAFLLQLVLLLRPGYLPVPYLVAMLPFAALSVAAAVELGLRRGVVRRSATALIAAAAVVAATPVWAHGLGTLTSDDLDRPLAQAEGWLEAHVDHHDRLLVDDAVWVDLVRAGFPRPKVVWYYKADTDPAVMRLTPRGWQDYDYMLVTESMRRSLQRSGTAPGGSVYPVLANAFTHSHLVASYGVGNDRVEVRRVLHGDQEATAPLSPGAHLRPLRHHHRHPAAAIPGPTSGPMSGPTSGPTSGPAPSGATSAPNHRRHQQHHQQHRHHHRPPGSQSPPSAPPSGAPTPSPPPASNPSLLDKVLDALL